MTIVGAAGNFPGRFRRTVSAGRPSGGVSAGALYAFLTGKRGWRQRDWQPTTSG